MKGKPYSKFNKRTINVQEVKIISKDIPVKSISLIPTIASKTSIQKIIQKVAYDKQKDQGVKIELGKKIDLGNDVDLGCKLDLGY
jgi:hypothetical protein